MRGPMCYVNEALHFGVHLAGKAEPSERVQGGTVNAQTTKSGWPFPSCQGMQDTRSQADPLPLKA